MKRLADGAMMVIARRDRYVDLRLGDRRQAKHLPFFGGPGEKTGQIVHMDPLHNDDDRAGLFVVEPGHHGICYPLVERGSAHF